MQRNRRELRARRNGGRAVFARLAVGAAMLAGLSACGSLGLGWGSSSDPDAPPSAGGSILKNIAMGGPEPTTPPKPNPPQTRFPAAVDQDAPDFECPILDVAPNGVAMRDFGGGAAEGGAQSLHHQISISNLARECKDAGSNIAMKLGVEGSVLLGPAGGPGTFSVPLVFEARLKDKVVASRRETLSVTIPPNETRAFFSTVVTDFTVPKDDDTDVYVGLSPGGGKALRPPPHHKRRHRS